MSDPKPDPVSLEIFNNLYQFIAEQMGIVLQNTSVSVNIKERLDFSCAIFDEDGLLVANAPHIPVHLGSMSESVLSLIRDQGKNIEPGNVYLANNPYNGGTHLPDVTAITPVFTENHRKPIFFVASRGHQADIGGITPGSMPPNSINITEEGILFDNFLLVKKGVFREAEVVNALQDHPYPARNIEQNLADFQAQVAANNCGARELEKMVAKYGLVVIQNYMKYLQQNAELAVRKAIASLPDGEFQVALDNGSQIAVKISIDRQKSQATVDFTGTSPQTNNNFNTPLAVTQAAVLYVFRTLVAENIPLNAGCLQPLSLVIPQGSLLNPVAPAAVVAGNVETSQKITNCLYGALGVMAASQGTMNNFTFGNEQYQYYETICGGSGAGKNFQGTDAVQTHMTNSRLTDPEILESRYPVLVSSFSLRKGSGGKGKYCGGDGVTRAIRFLEPMEAAILSGNRLNAPFGIAGGEAGKPGKNYLQKADQEIISLDSNDQVQVSAGDTIILETPGGGGYGLP